MDDYFKLAEHIAQKYNNRPPIPYPSSSPFYVAPYITCSWCNFVSFLDMISIGARDVIQSMEDKEKIFVGLSQMKPGTHIPIETLSPCQQCGRADAFFVGPHDFSVIIADRERAAREKKRRQVNACRKIQRAYRNHLRRMYGNAYSLAYLAHRHLLHKAALRITAVARGRLARRCAQTERHLLTIRDAHPLLLRHALVPFPDRIACFWYHRQVEVDLLFSNYLSLVERMGYNPPRKSVENNIREVAARIVARQSFLLALIQRLWRGVMARRIVKFYRTEISRVFQYSITRSMIIQRIYRGHFSRLLVTKLLHRRWKSNHMKHYLTFREKKDAQHKFSRLKEQLLIDYTKERKEEASVRMTSRYFPYSTSLSSQPSSLVSSSSLTSTLMSSNSSFSTSTTSLVPYSSSSTILESSRSVYPNGKPVGRMASFVASSYGDDRCQQSLHHVLQFNAMQEMMKATDLQEEQDRRQFILNRRKESGPLGFGERSQVMTTTQDGQEGGALAAGASLSTTLTQQPCPVLVESSRSKGMRHYFDSEMQDIFATMVNRVVHSTDHRSHKAMFVEYNQERQAKLEFQRQQEKLANRYGDLISPSRRNKGKILPPIAPTKPSSSSQESSHEIVKEESNTPSTSLSKNSNKSLKNATKNGNKNSNNNSNSSSNSSNSSSSSTSSVDLSATKDTFSKFAKPVKLSKYSLKHRFRDYKYPEGINESPMAWLEEDVEATIEYQHKKMMEERQKAIEEEKKSHNKFSST